ncbi:DUF4249 family protein [Mucilaginibacter pedocola]|uniref:DUF4249 domain-containing protein n=1 Tax=Mucilaginibacter pedocola TaxID=1792845 RepID=A0A1S9PKV5_9SPHI|nr:DUF4249 family protein [Mucilaginibacter pedocola]OOQ61602.1 hypothetical protein BC343_00565 [Mucilaginibacter pedocola]
MTRNIFYFIIALITVVSACKKDDNAAIAERPVVEAYLLAGRPISVRVYQQKAFSDTATYGPLLSGLQLQVSDGSQTVNLTESATGTYTYADGAFLQAGKTYTLQFTYNSIAISASTVMPQPTTGYATSLTNLSVPNERRDIADSVAVTYTWNNPDSLYHIMAFKNDEVTPYFIGGGFNTPANFTVNTEKAAVYQAKYRSFNYVGTYKVILFTVNEEYIKMLTSNTNTSSQKLDNPPGNIVNAYGIFTGMQADTLGLAINQ